jgi:hypothetical protein
MRWHWRPRWRGFRAWRQIDFAEVIFLGALGGLHPLQQFLHFLLADIDEGLDIAAQHALQAIRRGSDA